MDSTCAETGFAEAKRGKVIIRYTNYAHYRIINYDWSPNGIRLRVERIVDNSSSDRQIMELKNELD